ncbi:MAG: hypothetical protein YK1309IOTA_900018 [Marine Group I thaumarchaeote]|nr:MAG: hypothetical protein NPMRIOTA_140002 [Nitrosopumilales archaeon]GFN39888.1 MAG: hypothetical protein YK1309IOTA_900018 [Marine Group I thaumarchaeote]
MVSLYGFVENLGNKRHWQIEQTQNQYIKLWSNIEFSFENYLIFPVTIEIMQLTELEIEDMKNFINSLNLKNDSIVVVEGKRDSTALRNLGFCGKLCEFHRFKGLARFVDSVASYKNIIVLLDGDRKGKYLTSKIITQLERRTKVDLSFKRKLARITRGKIRYIEDLAMYTQFFQ